MARAPLSRMRVKLLHESLSGRGGRVGHGPLVPASGRCTASLPRRSVQGSLPALSTLPAPGQGRFHQAAIALQAVRQTRACPPARVVGS